jgi:hypothetical protein
MIATRKTKLTFAFVFCLVVHCVVRVCVRARYAECAEMFAQIASGELPLHISFAALSLIQTYNFETVFASFK